MTAGSAPLVTRTFAGGSAVAALALSTIALGAALAAMPPVARDIALLGPLAIGAVVDVRTRRIPNELTMAATLLALASAGPGGLLAAALGGVVAAVAGLTVAAVAQGGFGMGDVKLMTFAGVAVGVGAAIPFLLSMSLAGGALALGTVAARGAGRGATMPYAPAIAVGCAVAMFAG